MHSIDVVIPLFNCEKYIISAIASAQIQTANINKIIVVDDGSTDNGPTLVKQLLQKDNRICLIQGANHGPSAARNEGIKFSKAEFIAFLDSDDIWDENKISMQLKAMDSAKGIAFVHTLAQAIDAQGNHLGLIPLGRKEIDKKQPIVTIKSDFEAIRSGASIIYGSASSVLARRLMLIEAGCFDTTMRIAEDWDLWARLAQRGPVGFINRPLALIRINQESAQRSVLAESMAKSRLNGRISVATHWENDNVFLQQHRQLARRDAWNVIRWLLLKPAVLISFYKELRNHRLRAGRVVVTSALDYLNLILWGIAKTVKEILTSPQELRRLWGRFVAERKKAAGK